LYGPLVSGGLDPSSALTPGFWHQVTEVFEKNDTAYRMYDLLKRRNEGQCVGLNETAEIEEKEYLGDDDSLKTEQKKKDQKSEYTQCKERTICGVRAARSENNCALLQRGFGFGRTVAGQSTVESRGYGHECESVSVSDVLVQMVNVFSAMASRPVSFLAEVLS